MIHVRRRPADSSLSDWMRKSTRKDNPSIFRRANGIHVMLLLQYTT